MRIAFISGMNGYPAGGSEMLWSEAAYCLIAEGHEVMTSTREWPSVPEHIARLAKAGARTQLHVDRVAAPWVRMGSRLLGRPVRHPGVDPDWQRILEFQPDLVCVSDGGIYTSWMSRCLRAGVPYVCISQANSEAFWPEDDRAEEILRAHQGAVRSFFVSEANIEMFHRQCGVPLANAEVVRNPYNVHGEAALPWPEEEDMLRLACVGRLHPPSKGQDLICAVLAQAKWRERPLVVSLYGTGPCEQSLKRLVAGLQLEDRIHFRGHAENMEDVWAEHHALLLPSRYEGLPLVLVEAMLCGRTAVAADVAGVSEVLEDGSTGFLAKAPTVELLDEALERAWQARSEWKAMGQQAAAYIRKNVPADPARVFADRLISIAEGKTV